MYLKPIQTGYPEDSDARLVVRIIFIMFLMSHIVQWLRIFTDVRSQIPSCAKLKCRNLLCMPFFRHGGNIKLLLFKNLE
jgi:hypothetical protein